MLAPKKGAVWGVINKGSGLNYVCYILLFLLFLSPLPLAIAIKLSMLLSMCATFSVSYSVPRCCDFVKSNTPPQYDDFIIRVTIYFQSINLEAFCPVELYHSLCLLSATK